MTHCTFYLLITDVLHFYTSPLSYCPQVGKKINFYVRRNLEVNFHVENLIYYTWNFENKFDK